MHTVYIYTAIYQRRKKVLNIIIYIHINIYKSTLLPYRVNVEASGIQVNRYYLISYSHNRYFLYPCESKSDSRQFLKRDPH